MITVGYKPVAIRQNSDVALTGVTPKGTDGKEYTIQADHATSQVRYANPDDIADTALLEGGLFDFGIPQYVNVTALATSEAYTSVNIFVCDRDNSDHDVHVVTDAAGGYIQMPGGGVDVTASQILKVTTDANVVGGFVDVYIVKPG